jgi:hypothetical protein
MAKPKDPYAVKLDADQRHELTTRLVDAIRTGLEARSTLMDDGGLIDFAYSLYEQQPQMGISRARKNGADLTSPIGTQMVDTLTAITCKTVFVEPFWIVEGIGQDAAKAPTVEEFTQWRFEEMRGQQIAGQAAQQAFIEEGAIIEVCEDSREVHGVEVTKAKVQLAEDGSYLLDGDSGKPLPLLDEFGDPVEAEDAEEFVEVTRPKTDTLRRGASLRLHSLKDFLFLPGHAKDRRDVWAMAVRFWLPLEEVEERAKAGKYDKEAVAALGTNHEREPRTEHERSGTTVAVDHASKQVEKELWRIQFYANIDGKHLCFYVAIVSVHHQQILSITKDWIGRFRFEYLNPFPRTNSVYGYSLILHKLLTTIEGHTMWRNMNADRSMFKANAPMKRLMGAQWDPRVQPIGAGETIDVGSMDEIMPFEYEDVSQHSFQREREFYEEGARIAGVSDILASVNPKVSRTLGENEMVTEQSFTRAENPIRNLQEAFEGIGELIHAIEVKTLEEAEDGDGLEAPASVAQNVKLRTPDSQTAGDDAAFAFTAESIKGRFRFKPRGSVETADPNRRMNNFMNGIKAMQMARQMFPALQMRYASPQVAEAVNQQLVDLLKPRDKQAFLAPLQPPQGMLPPGAEQGMLPPGAPPQGPPSLGDGMIDEMLASLPGGMPQ